MKRMLRYKIGIRLVSLFITIELSKQFPFAIHVFSNSISIKVSHRNSVDSNDTKVK